MSKVFYDHLIIFTKVENTLRDMNLEIEEKHELMATVDELVHHRVLAKILEVLEEEVHHQFLEKVHASPFDTGIMEFINEHTEDDIEEILVKELEILEDEILRDFIDNE